MQIKPRLCNRTIVLLVGYEMRRSDVQVPFYVLMSSCLCPVESGAPGSVETFYCPDVDAQRPADNPLLSWKLGTLPVLLHVFIVHTTQDRSVHYLPVYSLFILLQRSEAEKRSQLCFLCVLTQTSVGSRPGEERTARWRGGKNRPPHKHNLILFYN